MTDTTRFGSKTQSGIDGLIPAIDLLLGYLNAIKQNRAHILLALRLLQLRIDLEKMREASNRSGST
jgi:hypothetical protein